MTSAIIAVSRRGAETAIRIAKAFPDATAFVPRRFYPAGLSDPAGVPEPPDGFVQTYGGKAAAVVAEQFERRAPLILVMATGAAVRLMAPLLRHKSEDPPVVVVDDAGRYAISLLSGHAGGANRLAEQVASGIGAQAIVTTASDAAGLPSIDEVARSLGWWIEPEAKLTRLAAALINGETVGVYQDVGERDWQRSPAPEHVRTYDSIEGLFAADLSSALIISDRVFELPEALSARAVICRPPVLVLGIGCSSGVEACEIDALVDATLARAGLSPLAAYAVATIDRRRDEPGLVAFIKARRLQIVTFSAAELDAAEGDWTRSEVVLAAVGTAGVAEPAALLCAGAPNLLVRKMKSRRVTLAVARVAE